MSPTAAPEFPTSFTGRRCVGSAVSIRAVRRRAPGSASRSPGPLLTCTTANCCSRTTARVCARRFSSRFGRMRPTALAPPERPSAFDDDLRADLRQPVELLREFQREPDTAVARRIAGVRAAVEGDPVAVDALHEGHWRIVVFLRAVERALFEHRPFAERGDMALVRC